MLHTPFPVQDFTGEEPFPVSGIPQRMPAHGGFFGDIGRAIFGRDASGSDIFGDVLRFAGDLIGRPDDGETSVVPGGNGRAPSRTIDIGRPDAVFTQVSALPERGEGIFNVDVGEIDLPPQDLTTAQIRAFLLREAGRAIGKKRIDYSTFKRLVKDLGVEAARQRLNLDETSMMFLLASPPKRRGRGISAASLRNVTRTLGKLNTVNRRVAEACRGTYPRRTTSRRSAASGTRITQVK